MTKNLTPGKITFLVVYGIVLTLLGRRVVTRLKNAKPAKASDEKLAYATVKS
jgi:hypothetical protein